MEFPEGCEVQAKEIQWKEQGYFLEQQLAHIIHLYLVFTGTRLFLVLKQYGAMTKLLASSEEESMVMQ